jgi:predicted enzyme related to lactoylglutathione lyase
MSFHHVRLAASLALVPLHPAAAATADPQPRAFLALRVSDADASAIWYARTFDLKLADRFSTASYEMRILDGERAVVELIQLRQDMPPAGPAALGYIKGGFTVADFDASVARWRAAGVTFRGRIIYNAQLKLHVAALSDPDGNIIQILGRSAAPAP